MSFTALTLAETAFKAMFRQGLARKIKTNFDDHESRIAAYESSSRMFDHFNDQPNADGLSFDVEHYGDNTVASISQIALLQGGPRWVLHSQAGSSWGAHACNVAKPSYSVARLTLASGFGGSGGSTYAGIQSRLLHRLDQIVQPITFTGRFALGVDDTFLIGMRERCTSLTENGVTTTRQGIWMERVDASNYRFKSYDGGTFTGSSFSRPTIGSWFEVSIVFSTGQALCYLNGSLKETIASHLPGATALSASYFGDIGGGTGPFNMDVDRALWQAAGQLDAP